MFWNVLTGSGRTGPGEIIHQLAGRMEAHGGRPTGN